MLHASYSKFSIFCCNLWVLEQLAWLAAQEFSRQCPRGAYWRLLGRGQVPRNRTTRPQQAGLCQSSCDHVIRRLIGPRQNHSASKIPITDIIRPAELESARCEKKRSFSHAVHGPPVKISAVITPASRSWQRQTSARSMHNEFARVALSFGGGQKKPAECSNSFMKASTTSSPTS